MKILVVGDFQGKFPEKLKKKIAKEEFDFVIGVGDYTGGDYWRPYLKYQFRESEKGKSMADLKTPEEFFGKKKLRGMEKTDIECGKKVLNELNKLGKKVYFVFGNTDDGWYDYPFSRKMKAKKSLKNFVGNKKNLFEMTYRNRKFKDLGLSGFGGYMDLKWYLKKKGDSKEVNQRRLKRIVNSRKLFFKNLKRLSGKQKIFVLHYPPKGVFDIIKDKGNAHSGKSSGIEFFTEAIRKYNPRLVLCGHMHEYQGVKKIGQSLVVNPGDAGEGKAAVIDIDEKGTKVRFIK